MRRGAADGIPFYRLHPSAELMVIFATLIVHGCQLQAIVAAYQLDGRTVDRWQQQSGKHCQRVHEHLIQQPRDLAHVQADFDYWSCDLNLMVGLPKS